MLNDVLIFCYMVTIKVEVQMLLIVKKLAVRKKGIQYQEGSGNITEF